MAKIIRSFRLRMIVLFGLSMLASGILTYFLYKGLQLYYHEYARPGDAVVQLRYFINRVGDVNFFMIVFVPLAILFFFLLTKPYAAYFDNISKGIHRLAVGDFTSRVELHSNDEFQDIAEDINRAGEKLKKAVERGDFAESSKDQLVLNLAHDLRTPLTSVLGYLDFILTNDHLTEDQARHYATIAYTKSRRLEKLIEELFEITRMNYGMLAVEKKPIDLSELLNQLNEELYPIFEKNNLTARLNVPPHIVISGEGELLARVFENLLTNAARYGKDGQYVDISCSLEGSDAVVQVINYGHAIPQEELPYLFEMFYTGDHARTYQGDSTGLGLFIAKNIVERHNGTISVESGLICTVFEVRLPLQV
ncbi:HAMP domain-containing sensor histidine kinase [Paenibacillus piri]|uniref:histidine kinase n=1 Tax=Paenibacillus piri TaxID=2547395 RepID=A0A4R5KK74_9BACL|nr:HAMP domain-containing sensor histidine kinase [Paenibacillus piri]TDF94750.1 HAMP domain-containing histidine kinase [Paenibacillus piri]